MRRPANFDPLRRRRVPLAKLRFASALVIEDLLVFES